ncbi:MAG: glycosyltransferase family 4 protein [Betaproteobacteria bacterium]|nr:glycosyltransferase family 4 protein [Betaproteobacteria bacterium]
MKKLLIITRNFPPLWGGMERLNWHMAEELSRFYEVRLIAPAGAAEHVSNTIKVTSVPLRPLWLFLLTAVTEAIREARLWHPDIVLAGSGLTAPLARMAARASGAKALVYAHGLDMTASHPVYRTLWLPHMRKLDGVIANSRATATLAEKIGVLPTRIGIVHPGVAMPDLDPDSRLRFRGSHGLGEAPVLLSVGRLTERKGMREFVRDILPMVVAEYSDAQLVVIGDVPEDSLYAKGQSIESIETVARAAGVASNVRFLGKRFGTELADAYTGADLHVFPVRYIPNDPEGFGMVAVEAAAHGLATVAYATGGVVDAVEDGVSGVLVQPGNHAAFAQAIVRLLEQPLAVEQMCAFAAGFEWSFFAKKIEKVLSSLPDDRNYGEAR